MTGAVLRQPDHDDDWIPPTGEELARCLFGAVKAGGCAVIVLMVALGGR